MSQGQNGLLIVSFNAYDINLYTLIQRCDGVRPVCGQCTSKGKADDCEYTGDVQGLTRIQLMEENIALLEARIRELEDPAQDSSVRLHPLVEQAAPEQVQLLSAMVPMEGKP